MYGISTLSARRSGWPAHSVRAGPDTPRARFGGLWCRLPACSVCSLEGCTSKLPPTRRHPMPNLPPDKTNFKMGNLPFVASFGSGTVVASPPTKRTPPPFVAPSLCLPVSSTKTNPNKPTCKNQPNTLCHNTLRHSAPLAHASLFCRTNPFRPATSTRPSCFLVMCSAES
jgi:hypothetical protein